MTTPRAVPDIPNTSATNTPTPKPNAKRKQEYNTLLDELVRERDAARYSLAEHEAQVNTLSSDLNERTAERDAARNTLGETHARVRELEAELVGLRNERDQLEQNLESERTRLEKARNKWNQDRAVLERGKEALSGVLAGIEEVQTRPFEW